MPMISHHRRVCFEVFIGLGLILCLPAASRSTAADPQAQSRTKKEALDFATIERVQQQVDILRGFEISKDPAIWTGALRTLIEIGKPAVPLLCEELDHTERNQSLRALGYVLRGCDDRRAIPALIRAIPRTLMPAGSDYGLPCDDPDLLKFLQQHANKPDRGGEHFSFGRPFREIFPALTKLTGVKHWEMEVNFVALGGGPRQQYIQRELYQRLGEFWFEWWAKNWEKYLSDANEAQIEFTRQALAESRARLEAMPRPPLPTEIPTGPNIEVGQGWSNHQISALKQFLDIDSGRDAKPPKILAALAKSPQPVPAVDEWAAAQGVDFYGIQRKLPGSDREFYVLQPVGMRVWRIDNDRYDTLQDELRSGNEFDRGKPVDGPIAQTDEAGNYTPDERATFLLITREGSCGVLQMGRQVKKEFAVGSAVSEDDMVLRYRLIYESTGGATD